VSRLVNWNFFNPIFFTPKDRCQKRLLHLHIYFDTLISSYVGRPQENTGDKKVVGIKFFAVELPNHVTIPPLLINCIWTCNKGHGNYAMSCLFVLPSLGKPTLVHFGDKEWSEEKVNDNGRESPWHEYTKFIKTFTQSHECSNQHIMRHQSE
jgi:hypothetical protein